MLLSCWMVERDGVNEDLCEMMCYDGKGRHAC